MRWIDFLANNDHGTFLVHVVPFVLAFCGTKVIGSCETMIANSKDYLQKVSAMMVLNIVDVVATIIVNLGRMENPDDGTPSAYRSITDYKNNPKMAATVAVSVGVVAPSSCRQLFTY